MRHGKFNPEWRKLNLSMFKIRILIPKKRLILKRYIDFDHEVRLSIEHLSEADKKLIVETKDLTTDTNEPRKKKFKVSQLHSIEVVNNNPWIDDRKHYCSYRVKIENI